MTIYHFLIVKYRLLLYNLFSLLKSGVLLSETFPATGVTGLRFSFSSFFSSLVYLLLLLITADLVIISLPSHPIGHFI